MAREHWEKQADNWLAWARTPGFDAYWQYSPVFFELVPPPHGRTLEVGCGEGRVARDLAARGHRVTGVDSTARLVSLAKEADSTSDYARCDGAALPFRDSSFDLVVFYNSLMDIDDMDAAVLEASRVLRPAGKLCVCVTHPTADAGSFESREPDAPFVIRASYLGPRRWFEGSAERDGLRMDFSGWAYTLEHYFVAMERAGLAVEALLEPAGEARWGRIPNFLMWRAAKQ